MVMMYVCEIIHLTQSNEAFFALPKKIENLWLSVQFIKESAFNVIVTNHHHTLHKCLLQLPYCRQG
jgi:hypothetical protein